MKSQKRRAGFAMVTALFLMSFTTLTLIVLSVTVLSQARYAQISSEDTQLRQLLTAGVNVAQTEIQSQNSTSVPIELPDSLRKQSAELTINIDSISPTQKTAEIQASLPHYHVSQKLVFELQQNTWHLTSAILNQ